MRETTVKLRETCVTATPYTPGSLHGLHAFTAFCPLAGPVQRNGATPLSSRARRSYGIGKSRLASLGSIACSTRFELVGRRGQVLSAATASQTVGYWSDSLIKLGIGRLFLGLMPVLGRSGADQPAKARW
jgi:hypothetical protein